MTGCANIVPPDGGAKDTTPPALLSLSPADSALNTRVSKITLRFNKFVEIRDLEKNMQLSPLLAMKPTVTSFGKRVEIILVDSLLKDNTTYIINLGNAIVDNRENTPFGDFVYTFSTGAYFDSLQLQGRVFNAESGLPDSGVVIAAYPAEEGDSAIVKKRPMYVGRSDAGGSFLIPSLPDREFHLYALRDSASDYVYSMKEDKIGFLDASVRPKGAGDSTQFRFYIFRQIDTATAATPTRPPVSRGKPQAGKALFAVNADTTNKEARTAEINAPLEITLMTRLNHLDADKVYLSYDDNGTEVEAITKITQDSAKILIQPEWMADKLYTLRLVKGWAKDTSGTDLLPGKYTFRTKREEDYGILRIAVTRQLTQPQNLLLVYSGTDTIYLKPLADSSVTLTRLRPGKYRMRIIEDVNGNGRWDAGNVFLKQQPEWVYPHLNEVEVKPGWEHEVDFAMPDFKARQGVREIKSATDPQK